MGKISAAIGVNPVSSATLAYFSTEKLYNVHLWINAEETFYVKHD